MVQWFSLSFQTSQRSLRSPRELHSHEKKQDWTHHVYRQHRHCWNHPAQSHFCSFDFLAPVTALIGTHYSSLQQQPLTLSHLIARQRRLPFHLCGFFKLSFSTSGGTSLKSPLIPTGNGAKWKNHFPQTFSFPRATNRLSSALLTMSSWNKTSPNPSSPFLPAIFSGSAQSQKSLPTQAQLEAQRWQRAAAELPRQLWQFLELI